MITSPYVRPSLKATRSGALDPLGKVKEWLDALGDLLDGTTLPGLSHQAFDLLALWARLRRTRNDLIAQTNGGALMNRAESLIQDRGRSLIQEALVVPTLSAWTQKAEALDESYEDLIDPIVRAQTAGLLISDLDDWGLVLYAGGDVGVADERLRAEVQRCSQWLAKNPHAFLAAGAQIQTVGQTIRPDLGAFDLGLATTAEKYIHLLDAIEEAEAELRFENVAPMEAEEFRRLAEAFHQSKQQRAVLQFPAAARGWLAPSYVPMQATAEEKQEEAPAVWRTLHWDEPDGKLFARIVVFDRLREDDPLDLVVYDAHSRAPARHITGKSVELAGVASKVDANGIAIFLRRDLEPSRLEEHPTLIIDNQEWLPRSKP